MTTRPMAVSGKAVVSSSSLPSSLAGRDIIKKGGNVYDALVATSLALAVTQNNLCGLGGDMLAILRRADGSIDYLNFLSSLLNPSGSVPIFKESLSERT